MTNATHSSLESKQSPVTRKMFTPAALNVLPGQEVLEKRTRAGKVYNLGGGRYQAVLYPDPVHFRNDKGEWEEIDNSLVLKDGVLENAAAELHARFAVGGSVTLSKESKTIGWTIQDAAPVAPQAANDMREVYPRHTAAHRIENVVSYPALFPDIDFECRITPSQIKDTLVFKTPESVRPVTFILSAPGLALSQAPSGEVAVSADGRTIFTLPAPQALTGDGELIPGSANATLTATGRDQWAWTCALDKAFAATASFPVRLDPVVKTEQITSAMDMAVTTDKQPSTTHPALGYSCNISHYDYNSGKCDAYLRFADDALPPIDSSHYVTNATLALRTTDRENNATYPSIPVYAREVLGEWNSATLTYENRPSLADKAVEYSVSPSSNGVYFYFNIANLVRKWYAGENHGLMLETLNGGLIKIGAAGATYHKPYVTIDYVSFAGLESYLAQESHACGRAGTAHVGLFNGNLVFSHQETATNGNLLPVSVNRYYNSCYRTVDPFGVGKGWKLSTQQTLHKETIGTVLHYVYTDGDGTRHYFKKIDNVWNDLSGLNLTLTLADDVATITDKGDNAMIFDPPTVEFDGDYANAKPLRQITDARGNAAAFASTGLVTTSATDGAGRVTTGVVSGGKLISLTAPGMPAVAYSYTGDRLTAITHEDGEITTYAYNDLDLLTGVVNHDGTSLEIAYLTAREPYRVERVTYLADGVAYAGRAYEYGDCRTTVTEMYPGENGELMPGKSLIYHFNDAGNVVSVNDELGYGCFAGYSDGAPLNHPDYVSKMQRAVCNYLKNHCFLTINDEWTGDKMDGVGECGYGDAEHYSGGRAYRLKKTSTTGRISVRQSVVLEKGKEYTLSAFFKTPGGADAQLRAEWLDGDGVTRYTESAPARSASSWNRAHVSFVLPADAQSSAVTVRLMATGGSGAVWYDAAQLEDGPIVNRHNLLRNGAFTVNSSGAPYGWTASDDTDANDCVTSASPGRPSDLPGNVLRLHGAATKAKVYYQYFNSMGQSGDTYVAGGWSRSCTRPRTAGTQTHATYEMEISAHKNADGLFHIVGRVQWSEEWSGWQFAAVPVVINFAYSDIRVRVIYRNSLNDAEFSNLFLHKEQFGRSYQYDAKGNVLSTKNLAALQSYATYDAFNNMLSYRQPGRPSGDKFTMTYGSTDAEKKTHLVKTSKSPLDIHQEYTYDSKGNVLTQKTRNSTGATFIKGETAYTTDQNYAAEQTDARGKTVSTVTDANKGI